MTPGIIWSLKLKTKRTKEYVCGITNTKMVNFHGGQTFAQKMYEVVIPNGRAIDQIMPKWGMSFIKRFIWPKG